MNFLVTTLAETKLAELAASLNTEGIGLSLMLLGGIAGLLAVVIAVSLGVKYMRNIVSFGYSYGESDEPAEFPDD